MKSMLVTLVALTATAAIQPARAHTELAESVPANGATVAAAPEAVQLRFSAPVRLTALAVQKDGGRKQSLGPLPGETTGSFAIALPALDEGHYVVTWRALSEDTHVVSGEFMFAVGSAMNHEAHESPDGSAAQESRTSPATTPGHAGSH